MRPELKAEEEEAEAATAAMNGALAGHEAVEGANGHDVEMDVDVEEGYDAGEGDLAIDD
jgi:hypothetical protein